jgi:hypothetical protein
MALHRESKILALHAAAIVAHAQKQKPAAPRDNLDTLRARVERVFDKFLHNAGRTLNDLARGDTVDE